MIVSVNMAQTIDGRSVRPEGRWFGLTSSYDRSKMDLIRKKHAAVTCGMNTLLSDNPDFSVKSDIEASPVPVILVNGRLPPLSLRVFNGPRKPILIYKKNNEKEVEAYLSKCNAYATSSFAPDSILSLLTSTGIHSILLEGGPTLNGLYFEADLVDHIYVTIVPFLLGRGEGFMHGSIPGFAEKKWILTDSEIKDHEIFLHYSRRIQEKIDSANQ